MPPPRGFGCASVVTAACLQPGAPNKLTAVANNAAAMVAITRWLLWRGAYSPGVGPIRPGLKRSAITYVLLAIVLCAPAVVCSTWRGPIRFSTSDPAGHANTAWCCGLWQVKPGQWIPDKIGLRAVACSVDPTAGAHSTQPGFPAPEWLHASYLQRIMFGWLPAVVYSGPQCL